MTIGATLAIALFLIAVYQLRTLYRMTLCENPDCAEHKRVKEIALARLCVALLAITGGIVVMTIG